MIAALLLSLVLAAPAAAGIRAPAGIAVQDVASGLGKPSNIAFDPAGGIWTTSAGYTVASTDGVWFTRRRGAKPRHVIGKLNSALGLTWFRGELYVSHVTPYINSRSVRGRVVAYGGWTGTRFKHRRTVVKNIPTGLHRVNSIVAGPGGRLYLGVGSEGDATAGSKYGGTVVSFLPSGKGFRVEARGLRNPYGLAFAPDGATLLVSDNGRDDLGNNRPPEELNQFLPTGRVPHFGFPRCWGRRGGSCSGTVPPLAELAPHSAAGGVATAETFGPYGPSAFVAEHGSTIAKPATGAVVVRVPLTSTHTAARGFAKGFKQYDPLGVALGRDGALYVTLWRSGRVVRFVP